MLSRFLNIWGATGEKYAYRYMVKSDRWNERWHNSLIDVLTHRKKGGNAMVIVGAGHSLNTLTKDEIRFFESMDSIGVNFAAFNEHLKPKECLMELDEVRHERSAIMSTMIKKGNGNQRFYLNLLHARRIPDVTTQLLELDNVFCFDVVRFRTLKKWWFKMNALIYLKFTYRFFRRPIHHGASIVMALTIGLMRGYREIHLVGVDLNGGQYFYEHPDYERSQLKGLMEMDRAVMQRATKGIHPTQDPAIAVGFGELAIGDTVPFIVSLLQKQGTRIFVRGEDSGFHKYLRM